MAAQRIKVIPDRIFHKLWDGAEDFDNVHDYISAFTSPLSKSKINFYKYKIEYDLSCMILKSIFDYKKKTMASLVKELNIKPIELSHRFCIPIRTIENWMSENRTPPDYLKLFIAEIYDIHFLPQYVYTESLNKQRGRYSEDNELKDNNKSPLIDIDDLPVTSESDYESYDFDFSLIDKRMKEFEERYNKKQKSSSPDILNRTDYLDSILKKK